MNRKTTAGQAGMNDGGREARPDRQTPKRLPDNTDADRLIRRLSLEVKGSW